jgi:ketosteroid isomerase-like protein
LKSIRDGITKYSIIRRRDTKIIINADNAIVTATWFAKLQNKPNPPLETTARYTHVYVKKDGRWQLTMHQSTEIK